MRAVVTGGAGFIGSHLVEVLQSEGWDVEVIDRVLGRSIQQVIHTPKADVIYHLASPVGPLGVLDWAGRLAPEVIETSRDVAGWALANGCPMVNVSTSEVYGSGGIDRESDPCTFGPAITARREYAVAKLAAETMLHNMRALDVRTVRPFNVAGPRQQPDGGFVLPRFVRAALRREALTVYAPGTQRRAFAHVADIAEGIYLAGVEGERGGIYNLGAPDNVCTIRQLAEDVIREVGRGRIEVVDPRDLHGPAFAEAPDKVPDISLAQRVLGYMPRYDRAETVASVIAYWRRRTA